MITASHLRIQLLLLVCFTSSSVYGWQPYKTDVTQQAFSESVEDEDHLEPLEEDEHVDESYYLINYVYAAALDYHNVHLEIKRNEKSGKYEMQQWSEWTVGIQDRPKRETLAIPVKVKIPADIAATVYDMWVNALFEVRYDRKANDGLDGWTDIFSVYVRGKGWLHGSVWCPMKDLPPKWLEDSASALMAFAKDHDEAKCRRTITELHQKLFDYLLKNGKN